MKSNLTTLLITALIFLLSISAYGQRTNKWLYFPINTDNNRIDLGELNITGNSLTVEALITMRASAPESYYDIVSKHRGPMDCNYLLRPTDFEMSTTSGFVTLYNPMDLCLDSTYHVAATYDGDSIKYFVNGLEVASNHWTGILTQSEHTAGIGNMSTISNFYEQFIGYIDEVRIWNVARSQADIANNMYNLPNPTTQSGLLAYYKFDGSYSNLQGNTIYNGTPIGSQLQDIVNPFYNGSVSGLPANVSITISVSENPICSGTPATFTAVPVNGGSSPIYHWKVNGTNVGTNSPVFTYTPSNGDVVVCVLTSSIVCSTNNPATSNQIVMIVDNLLPVSISIIASANPFCQGSPVTFTATYTNGGLNPTFQWKVNGINAGTNSSLFTYNPGNGDIVNCILHSSITCPTGNPATSNSITMIEIPGTPVSVSIVASANPVCAGTLVTFTATPINPGTSPLYQWKINGVNSGTNSPVFNYIPLNADVITCILTSSITQCTLNNPATSNAITMDVNPILPVSITISPSSNPVCVGDQVTVTAMPVNGGTSPSYQWMVNGIPAGVSLSTYSFIPTNGDLVYCILTSSEACISGNPATSNQIHLTVDSILPVNVSISASDSLICPGTPVTFTATPINGGTAPHFQWKVNGVNMGPDSAVFTFVPFNNVSVYCILTSGIQCTSGNPATSNTVFVSCYPAVPVNLGPDTTICQGNTATFDAGTCNGCSYLWSDLTTGQQNIGTGQTITTADTGMYCVAVTDSNGCTGRDTVQLFYYLFTPGITGNNTTCIDTLFNYYQTEPGMSDYLWNISQGGAIISGAGTNTITVKWNEPGNQFLTVNYTIAAGCTALNPTIYPILVYLVPGQAGNIKGPGQLCAGSPEQIYSVDSIPYAQSYVWQVPPGFQITSGLGTNTVTIALDPTTSSGDFYVYGVNLCGTGPLSPPFHFTVLQLPVVDAGPDQAILYDSTAILSGIVTGPSGDASSYWWEPASLLVDNTSLITGTVNLTRDTLFILTATDLITGCQGKDSIRITVFNPEITEGCLVFHNVITPNGDGLNDKWIIDCIENFPENNVVIFNRWGDKIMHFDNYDNVSKVWKGANKNGKPLPDGTYYYLLTIKNGGRYSGWILLRGF